MRTQQAATLSYVQNDTQPPVSFTIVGTDGVTPMDLTGYQATLAFRVSPTRVVTKAATFTNAAGGQFSFGWAAGDLDTVGQYQAQVTLISSAGGRQSWQQIFITVVPQAGS